jgi:type II secretory pathway pseudopilin PulG
MSQKLKKWSGKSGAKLRFLGSKKGFSVLEIIVVITISVMILATTTIFENRMLIDARFETLTQELIESLKLAQMRSITRFKDNQWGVNFTTNSFTLFRGISFALRDSTYDIQTNLPATVTLSNLTFNGGGSQVVFQKISGSTTNYGTLMINSQLGNTKTISINALGQVEISSST